MKSIPQRIRNRLLAAQQQEPDHVPAWLRRIVRAFSGGDSWTASFVRGLLWKYRWLIAAALLMNLGAGIAEAMTLGIFTLALNLLNATFSGTSLEASGILNTTVLQIAQWMGGQQPLFILVILAVLFQILRSALDYAARAAAIYLRAWLEGDIQRRVIHQLLNLRYQQIIENRVGNLASYTNQVQEVGYLVQALNQTLNDLMLITAYLVVLLWLSWQFTLVSVVVLALFTLALNRLRAGIHRSITGFIATSVQMNERVVEYLQGIRLVHIFGREATVINGVNQLINSAILLRRMAMIRRALISPLFQSISAIGLAIFLGIGYWAVSTSRLLSVGELVSYLFVVYRTMPRIAGLNYQLGQIATQLPFVTRIAQLLNPADKELEYTPGRAIEQLTEGIEFRAVDLRYPGGEREALRQLSFHIPKGKMLALVGSSGSGKSSIINLLLGLYRPTGGKILVDGLDLQSYDLASWRRMIGVVDQDTLIFSYSIADNIRFGKPDASDAEVVAAAQIANAHQFIQELPQGYQTEVGDCGYKLSGGQRQRIAIARAVINNPSLLLFDEATSALDSQTERLIQDSLEQLRRERTVVVIAHRLSTITKADQILLLEDGQILEQGTHQELLALHGHYAAMWHLQAEAA